MTTDPFVVPDNAPREAPTAVLAGRRWRHLADAAVLYPTTDTSRDVLPVAIYVDDQDNTVYFGRAFMVDPHRGPLGLDVGGWWMNASEELLRAVRDRDPQATAIFAMHATDPGSPNDDLVYRVTASTRRSADYIDPGWLMTDTTEIAAAMGELPWVFSPAATFTDAEAHLPGRRALVGEHRLDVDVVAELNASALRALNALTGGQP